jgi:hypothetical protein
MREIGREGGKGIEGGGMARLVFREVWRVGGIGREHGDIDWGLNTSIETMHLKGIEIHRIVLINRLYCECEIP